MSKTVKDNIYKCHTYHVRISPDKLRRVAKLIRRRNVKDSINILNNLPHKGSRIILSL